MTTITVKLPDADLASVKAAVERIYGGHSLMWAMERQGLTAYPLSDEPVIITYDPHRMRSSSGNSEGR